MYATKKIQIGTVIETTTLLVRFSDIQSQIGTVLKRSSNIINEKYIYVRIYHYNVQVFKVQIPSLDSCTFLVHKMVVYNQTIVFLTLFKICLKVIYQALFTPNIYII